MVYTEIQERNGKRYYYRVSSVRQGKKVNKLRKYMGSNLSDPQIINEEQEADKRMLNKKDIKIKRDLNLIKPKIILVLKRYKVNKAGIFGSYVRGEQKKGSDVDIIIEPPKGIGFKFVSIALELEEKLNKKVDLLTYKGIHPLIKKKIMQEEIRII